MCYEYGEGVEVDLEKAYKLYLESAKQGNKQAILNLASCYENGKGVKKNLGMAKELYEKAKA